MSWQKKKLGDFLIRSKIPVEIEDSKEYKRVKIRINHNGVSLRDMEQGIKIGTKKQFILKAGQFIVSKIDARYGAFGIAPDEVDGAIITGNFWAYNFDRSKINIDWLNHYTNSPEFYEICERASAGITHRKYLDEKTFLNHEVYLPDADEQKVFIINAREKKTSFSFLSTELTYQQNLLKKLRQSLLREAMQGKLVKQDKKDRTGKELLEKIKGVRDKLIKTKKLKAGKSTEQPVSFTDEYTIPENWTWCKSDDIFFVTKLAGFEYSEHIIKLKESGEIPVIRAQNVRPLEITKKNLLYIDKKTSLLLERCSLTKKCLLVTFIGAGIGDVATFEEKERWHLAPNVAKMEPFEGCEELINIKFINYFLMSGIGQREIFKHVKATAQPSLSMATIRDIDIPFPPIAEQTRIVKKLEEVMNLCDELKTTITDNQKYTNQLLQVALKGALQIREVEVEVEI